MQTKSASFQDEIFVTWHINTNDTDSFVNDFIVALQSQRQQQQQQQQHQHMIMTMISL